MAGWLAVWNTSQILRRAFAEQKQCVRETYRLAAEIVRTPDGVPPEYRVSLGKLPYGALSVRRNLFSTLFLSIYQMLGIPADRRLLFGRLNQLFRIWVTAADNLLDAEDKVVLPLQLPRGSRTMREVVGIMTADRLLTEILWTAAEQGTLTPEEARRISSGSLQALLGSAGQEAAEERGVIERPPAEHVLFVIHRLKTGLLFHIPFVGPDATGEGSTPLAEEIREALLSFGLGCQLLDDVRDLATDLRERRHNYVLSWLAENQPGTYSALLTRDLEALPTRLYREVPDIARRTAMRAYGMMRDAAARLSACGLALGKEGPARLAKTMFRVLDVAELAETGNG